MPSSFSPNSKWIAALVVMPLVAACNYIPLKMRSTGTPAQSMKVSAEDDHRTLAQLEDLLILMRKLLETDVASRKILDGQLQKSFDADPSVTNKARLAMALTLPGHSTSEFIKAQKLIVEMESSPGKLPRAIRLYLRTRVDLMKQTRALEDKMQVLDNDNKDRTQELDDIRAQIKALTVVEQEIETASKKAVPSR